MNDAKKKVVFILNPHSGTHSKDTIPAIIADTLDHEAFDHEVRFTEYAGHAAAMARQCADEGVDICVAVGGDGTVNEVARSLVHTQTALGIVPCGSGNGLARHLCLPLDPRKAIALLNRCKIEALDYGVINGLPFFCTCGMGFDAFISQKFAEAGKRGPLTYMESVLKEGLKYKPATYEVEDDEGVMRCKAYLVACANASQYGNNAFIAPQASMADGLMDVVVMEPFTAFDAPQVCIDMMNRTLDKNSKVKTFRAKRIHIHRSEEGPIHYDGDPIVTGRDIDVHVEERGIRIVVNPDATEGDGRPNSLLAAFSEFFANVNGVREDIERQGRKVKAINKKLLRRLSNI